MDTLRLAVVDDHPAILHGVVEALAGYLTCTIDAIVARDLAQLIVAAGTDGVDLVLLDIQLGDGSDPADNVETLRRRGWPVLLFTQEVRLRIIASCLAAGALGIVGKHEELSELARAVRHVVDGEPYLSDIWAAALDNDAGWQSPHLSAREQEALRLYATGLPLKSVARRMIVTPDTVKEYLLRVRRKYTELGRQAGTKTDLYMRAVEDGFLPPPDEPHIDLR
ncbi:response regulator transcription factor [Mobilicoccus sp.]|uniref:response regulator transcription factor n=1 Tax=Mobilicoccus sp. TaxID=2034349 RepID=UPI0028A7B9AE|nr:response regulator transcription factor [Mobilicoccus sp.]